MNGNFYGIPSSTWALAPISDIAEINPKLDKSGIDDDLEVSFVPMPAVEVETGGIEVSAIRRFGEVKKGYTSFREGDVLFAKITPCMENGKMAVVPALRNGLGFDSTEFHVLRAKDGIAPEYLYYFVSSKRIRIDAEHNMTGAVGQRRVPNIYLSNHPIPVPPTNEQRRIVAKVEALFSELDKGVESLKTAREQLKVYRQAVLKHAFEGKLTAQWREERNLRPWVETTMGAVLSFVTSGSRGWAKYYSSEGDIFIRAQNLKHDRLDLDEVAYVQLPEKSEGMRTRVQVGDLLVTITGANVTKTGYVHSNLGNAYVSQHVALCRPVKIADTEFLYWYLIAEVAGRKQLNEFAYGAGKPSLNLDNIRSVYISLPGLDEQKAIVGQIKELLSVEEYLNSAIDAELKRTEALRQSILKKAFSGQLILQDPNDESASVLLERIKAEKLKEPSTTRRSRKESA